MDVDVFIPCFIDQLFPQTAWNMVRILEKVGCKVHYNPDQTCCGQPAFNAGYWDQCKEVGEKFLNDFSKDRIIISPSASCVGMVKNYYGEIFSKTTLHNEYKSVQKNMYELSDFLVNVMKVTDLGARLDARITYHDSCAGLREVGIRREPRELLAKVKGLELVEMKDTDTCCGFGGTFSVKYEPIAVGMAEQKIIHAEATGVDYIVSTDQSCLMHLQGFLKAQGKPLQIMHLADVLAAGWDA